MDFSASSKISQKSGLEVHEADDGLIVFNPATDKVHHLNPTAGVLFELCAEPNTVSSLGELLRQLYELDTVPFEDVKTGIKQLLGEGVLTTANGE